MAKIKRYTEKDGGYHGELGFMCPGCMCIHFVSDKHTDIRCTPPIWEFNDNYESPTIRASVLTWGYGFNKETGNHDKEVDRCHSFITDGKIQFLSDCQHELSGKTVELPEIE